MPAPSRAAATLRDARRIRAGASDADFPAPPSGLSWRLARRSRWQHGALRAADDPAEDGLPPKSRKPWFHRWHPGDKALPWLGGDEWCRRTVVLCLPLIGQAVIPLWTCQDARCEACIHDCRPTGTAPGAP